MNPLLIEQAHGLSALAAERLLRHWLHQAERDFGLRCERCAADGLAGVGDPAPMPATPVSEAQIGERWRFARPGLTGTLRVDAEKLHLQLQLGFLLRPYAPRIDAELRQNLARDLAAFGAG